MKTVRPFHSLAATLVALHFTACSGVQITHVAPGKSASAHLAERNKPKAPMEPTATMLLASNNPGQNPQLPQFPLPPLPSGEVNIPPASGTGSAVAESFSRGTFAMQAGQNAEAIAAFEETVKLDPAFSDAWSNLAMLYQKTGNTAKATEAFKKAKSLGDVNSGGISRATTDPVLIP